MFMFTINHETFLCLLIHDCCLIVIDCTAEAEYGYCCGGTLLDVVYKDFCFLIIRFSLISAVLHTINLLRIYYIYFIVTFFSVSFIHKIQRSLFNYWCSNEELPERSLSFTLKSLFLKRLNQCSQISRDGACSP